ncbi:MAG: hypothetical protein HYV03_03385 [Deltaproteobacteria bacterium]|nr:hypothetical protein [Deltaproteobacteria bacterium]
MRQHGPGGFTLIEMILTMVLVAMTVFGTASLVISALDSYGQARERRQAVQTARYAIDRMAREIRQITTPASYILLANGTTFRYATQLVPLAFVTFQVNGNQLLRDVDLMAGNVVVGTGFSYFNAAGLPAVGIADIARVRLEVRIDTGVAAYGQVHLQTDIYLRNRYYAGFTQP